ncbi:MAG: phenylalanine--tRNA ligase subunit beta [Eubacteriales bacterium]|nr:phenylalanine--tRNA ligase subunit beta [Eubacteriales bacterium]MDD3882407.1 phenylalanine--tRNA ligase subunit beta [Eubacteriales bacterium]MDD4512372.1 phenylalanine--tRNA ligase subunit beta [Eubacteriales bacterium]
MKAPMKWLRDYTEIPLSPLEYQSKMIMSGTGVEDMEDLTAERRGVVVGKVLKCDKHPDSDHLHVCLVDTGREEKLQIVCGAPNVAEGQLVCVAEVGAVLPKDVKIKKGKLRGVESCGMLCSGPEIGVPVELYPSVGDEGILVFNEEHPLGQDVNEIFGLNDYVADFEILANRPDCLCVWGVARESAAACGTEFKKPEITVKTVAGKVEDSVKISVLDEALCPRYAARVIKNVRVAPSPDWLRQYLFAAGMRSINNIVDITNFVMLETGHPMHAFDLDKVRGNEIIVRKARKGEKITTLDEKEYELSGIELLICDSEGATGIAGVMGGAESEITESTKSVLFECAAFDRTGTRLTSRSLGIRTEASGRFEKGVSDKTVMEALMRASQLVNLLDAGDVVEGIYDNYPAPTENKPIAASVKSMQNYIGVKVPAEEMKRILEKLFFTVTLSGDVITATAPDFRQDVEGEADLAEEVLRIYGYSHIPSTKLRGETTMGGRSERMILSDKVHSIMCGMGYYEIMNYSFVSMKLLEKLNLPEGSPWLAPLRLRNPLGEDTAVMRPTLAASMLDTLSRNMSRSAESCRLFEIAAVYDGTKKTAEGLPEETQMLSIGAYGAGMDFFAMRSLVEALLSSFGVKCDIRRSGESWLHPGRGCELLIGDTVLAVLGEAHPDVLANFDLNQRAYIAAVNLTELKKLEKPLGEVPALPKYPAVSRDLAFVVAEETELGRMMTDMEKASGNMLEGIRLFDVYRGTGIETGKKSAAFSLTFRAKDHTLTENEVNAAVKRVIKRMESDYQAALRS